MSATAFSCVKERFTQFVQASSEKDRNDSCGQFLVSCGRFYEQIHPGKKSCLLHGNFLQKAIEVSTEAILVDYPGSFNRLKPLAENYIRTWEVLTLHLSVSGSGEEIPSDEFVQKSDAFVAANKTFVRQYVREVKVIAKFTSEGAQLNFPRTVEQFYKTVMGQIVRDLSILPLVEEMFANADPRLFDLIPYFVVLSLLNQSWEEGKLPEFFAPLEIKLQSLKQAYLSLPESDQVLLSKPALSVSGEVEATGYLSDSAKKVFRDIFEFIYESRNGNDEKSSFAAINNALFEFIIRDLELARSIRNYPDMAQVSSPPEIVEFLYKLPESDYAQFKSTFTLLPEQHDLLNTPLSEIAQRRNFYRIQAIVKLAQKLSA